MYIYIYTMNRIACDTKIAGLRLERAYDRMMDKDVKTDELDAEIGAKEVECKAEELVSGGRRRRRRKTRRGRRYRKRGGSTTHYAGQSIRAPPGEWVSKRGYIDAPGTYPFLPARGPLLQAGGGGCGAQPAASATVPGQTGGMGPFPGVYMGKARRSSKATHKKHKRKHHSKKSKHSAKKGRSKSHGSKKTHRHSGL